MKETALYIHIPFCDHKCIYCDFYSIVSYENTGTYLESLLKEVDFYSNKYSQEREIISIYFGGGTPSFMEPEYISKIIEKIKNQFAVRSNAEITLETNPGTVTKSKLAEFKKAGINRISVGIQSFNKDELEFLTRIHDAQTAIDTVHYAKDSGFENISIDLIFNLPDQSKEKWLFNLRTAVKLPIKHISAYSLILERGTILNKMVLDGKVKMQNEDYDAELYETTIDFLKEEGFAQYEVSNFTKPGYECIHNLAYWRYKDYLGLGTSAHSFIASKGGELNGKRWWNFSSVKFYNAAVNQYNNGIAGEEILFQRQMLDEYVMLAFRSNGLDIKEMENLFGAEWFLANEKFLTELIIKGFVENQNSILKLTRKGYELCDEIIANFVS